MSILIEEIECAFNLMEVVKALNENGTKIIRDGTLWYITDIFNGYIIGEGKTLNDAVYEATNYMGIK